MLDKLIESRAPSFNELAIQLTQRIEKIKGSEENEMVASVKWLKES